MENILISILLLLFNVCSYSQNYIEKSRVYLSEKQNNPASVIPVLLLEAYSKGDIKGYLKSVSESL